MTLTNKINNKQYNVVRNEKITMIISLTTFQPEFN